MSHTKAHKKAKGGRVAYSGGSSNVVKEADEMKRGGKAVGKIAGSGGKSRMKKARGGSCDANPFSSAHRG